MTDKYDDGHVCQSTDQRYKTRTEQKPCDGATAVVARQEESLIARKITKPTGQSEEGIHYFSAVTQQKLPCSCQRDGAAESIHDENSLASTSTMIAEKTDRSDNSEQPNSVTSSNNLNLDGSPMTPIQSNSSPQSSDSSSASDNQVRPLLQYLQAQPPAGTQWFERKLSLSMCSRGRKPPPNRPCCAQRSGYLLRHSWSGSKSRKCTLNKLPCYRLNSSPESSGENDTQCSCTTDSKSHPYSRCSNPGSCTNLDGGTFEVKVDVHRTVTGEPIVVGQKIEARRFKRRKLIPRDDPLAIKTDVRENVRTISVRPPAVFNNTYQPRLNEPYEAIGSVWMNVANLTTYGCPHCWKYLRHVFVTLTILLAFGSVVSVILVALWVAYRTYWS